MFSLSSYTFSQLHEEGNEASQSIDISETIDPSVNPHLHLDFDVFLRAASTGQHKQVNINHMTLTCKCNLLHVCSREVVGFVIHMMRLLPIQERRILRFWFYDEVPIEQRHQLVQTFFRDIMKGGFPKGYFYNFVVYCAVSTVQNVPTST